MRSMADLYFAGEILQHVVGRRVIVLQLLVVMFIQSFQDW